MTQILRSLTTLSQRARADNDVTLRSCLEDRIKHVRILILIGEEHAALLTAALRRGEAREVAYQLSLIEIARKTTHLQFADATECPDATSTSTQHTPVEVEIDSRIRRDDPTALPPREIHLERPPPGSTR